MDSYSYIKKQWIVSPAARRMYRFSAFLSLTVFLWPWLPWLIPAGRMSEAAASYARVLLLASVLGCVITQSAMEVFLFRFDNSRPVKQIFWFCFLLLPVLGAALYCLLVYSRPDVLRQAAIQRVEAAHTH
jgi:hypothetical protein